MAAPPAVTAAMMPTSGRPTFIRARLRLRWCRGGTNARTALIHGIALNNLVEFAAIEPDATTLGTIVDLDPLAFAHSKIDLTSRAEQSRVLCSSRIIHHRGSFHFAC